MNTISRRNFIRRSSLTVAAGLTLGCFPSIASSFAIKQSKITAGTIPLDKKLDPTWDNSEKNQ